MTVKIKYGRNGAVKSIKGNVGRTRMNRAALELWKGNVEPTTGYKLRRFFKRFFTALKLFYCVENKSRGGKPLPCRASRGGNAVYRIGGTYKCLKRKKPPGRPPRTAN